MKEKSKWDGIDTDKALELYGDMADTEDVFQEVFCAWSDTKIGSAVMSI